MNGTPARIFTLDLNTELHTAFSAVARSRNLHTREFLRGLVELFGDKAKTDTQKLKANRTLTRRAAPASGRTCKLIFVVNTGLTHKLTTLCDALDSEPQTTLVNLIELAVNAAQKERHQ